MPPKDLHAVLPRLALIGAVLAVIAGLFAWAGGWLTPARVSGGSIADAIEANTGKVFAGTRRAHAKGLCVSGAFVANGAGVALSRAPLFVAGTYAVTGRFSLAGPNPGASDGRNVFHALGLRFALPGGVEWRMALDHVPTFIVATPADFQALMVASTPVAATGKPDPVRMAAFLAAHPETARFMAMMKAAPLPSSFANGTYYSIDAFRFTSAAGVTQAVRWQFEPEDAFGELDKSKLDQMPNDALFDEYIVRSRKGPVRWHLMIVPANPGDRTDNGTIAWGPSHRKIDVGTLTLDNAATETTGNYRDLVFDPLILPPGVAASDDPLLAGRSAAYSASFRRRAREGAPADPLSIHQGAAK